MMHFWTTLWDWSSLESVRRVHSFFEGWALVFFALLVLFDVLAHLSEDNHKETSQTVDATRCPSFAADQDEGARSGSGRRVPPLVSEIQATITGADDRTKGSLTPDLLTHSP